MDPFSAAASGIAVVSLTIQLIDSVRQISDGYRQRFVLGLFDLQEKCGANLFATLRPISTIEKEFEGSQTLEIRASDEDVRRYLDGNMFQLPRFVARNLELQEEIKTAIDKAVHGMYVVYFKP
jgi:hypothetical protein